jgi:hypothetical protein
MSKNENPKYFCVKMLAFPGLQGPALLKYCVVKFNKYNNTIYANKKYIKIYLKNSLKT